jgi:hypothetical protein
MRTLYTLLFLSTAIAQQLLAQNGGSQPDTLLIEPVIGTPTDMMLSAPTGDDDLWVNYDKDLKPGYCVKKGATLHGWYIERDFSFPDSILTENQAFTSCSYLLGGAQNENWLILPPIFIPDDSYWLLWRSLSAEGPAFLDGYKVLASTASNLPASGDFSHLLFKAAEMLDFVSAGGFSLELDDYVFSDGYIHANGFTDSSYFYLLAEGGPYAGKLEPHQVKLNAFAGETIYIAFYHDSTDDLMLQLDDILVTRTIATRQPDNFLNFDIMPNPAISSTYVVWTLKKPEPGRLQLRDQSGKLLLEKKFSAYEQGQMFLELDGLPSGVHHCTLQTASGLATRKLVKL